MQKINECNDNLRECWGILNELSGRGKTKDKFPIEKYLNRASSDLNKNILHEVANDFNAYFSAVGQNLAISIDSTGPPVVNDYDFATDTTFHLTTVTELLPGVTNSLHPF